MITSAFISQLRRDYNDNPKLHKDTRNGDGSSTIFKTKFAPVKESSVTVAVNNATKTETTEYMLDYDTGDLQMVSAPGNGLPLDIIYKEVNFRDAHWLDAIKSAYRAFGDQIYGAVYMNTSALQLSANVQKFNLPANCIRLLSVFESDSISGRYYPLRTNWKYDRRANQLILSNVKTTQSFAALSYLTKITPPSAVSMAMPGEDAWLEAVQHRAGAFYLRSMANRVAQQGNVTVEEGHLNVQALRVLANDHEAQFEVLRKRIKPVMPSLDIPYWDPKAGSLP